MKQHILMGKNLVIYSILNLNFKLTFSNKKRGFLKIGKKGEILEDFLRRMHSSRLDSQTLNLNEHTLP